MKILPLLLSLFNYGIVSRAYIFEKCTSQSSLRNETKIVRTLNGPVKGECYNIPVSYSNLSTRNYDVFTWLSVPYAEPPTGSNRFMQPKPVKSWSETRDALTWPKSCVQAGVSVFPSFYSEDCLYLNIFVRNDTYLNREKQLVPIMLWIHGGSFVVGTSSQDEVEPSTLVASQNVIVVSINYRLNVFGFLHLADSDASGNAGFLDQNLAMKWVYENAKAFGGDNSKITIFGESAGSWSVGFHLFYQQSWKYFRNAILESGAPTGRNNFYFLSSSEDSTKNAESLLNKNGCRNGTRNERLQCAQNIDAAILFQSTASSSDFDRYPFDRLTIDNYVFSKSIDQLVEDGKFKQCNIITGFNSDEFGYFLPSYFPLDTTPNTLDFFDTAIYILALSYDKIADFSLIQSVKETYFGVSNLTTLDQSSIDYFKILIQIQSDVLFVCPAIDIAELYSKNGLKAYAYEYKFRNPSSPFPIELGQALHTEEIPMVFGEPLSNKIPPLIDENPYSASGFNYSIQDKLFSEKVMRYWSDFAKYDDPNYSQANARWNQFGDRLSLSYLSATNKMRVGQYLLLTNDNIGMTYDYSSHKCDFWNYTKNADGFYISSATTSAITFKSMLVVCLVNFFIYRNI